MSCYAVGTRGIFFFSHRILSKSLRFFFFRANLLQKMRCKGHTDFLTSSSPTEKSMFFLTEESSTSEDRCWWKQLNEWLNACSRKKRECEICVHTLHTQHTPEGPGSQCSTVCLHECVCMMFEYNRQRCYKSWRRKKRGSKITCDDAEEKENTHTYSHTLILTHTTATSSYVVRRSNWRG